MQLARNGKIYVAGNAEPHLNALSVINYPNDFDGDSGFESLSVNLQSGTSRLGLPVFLASELRNRIITENLCANETFEFELDTYAPFESVVWGFGDGQTSTETNPSHQYERSGKYLVKATITMGECVIDLYKNIEAYHVPNPLENQSLSQCVANESDLPLFNLYEIEDKLNLLNKDNELFFFNTLDDALNEQYPIENPESYQNTIPGEELFVRIISPEGCFDTSNFFLETLSVNLDNIEPLFGCESSDGINGNNESLFDLRAKTGSLKIQFGFDDTVNVQYYATYEDAQLESNPLPYNYISVEKTIWLRVEDGLNDCAGLDSFELLVSEPIYMDIVERYKLCYDPVKSSVTLDGGIGNERWEWMNDQDMVLSTQRIFTTTETGRYSVTAYKTQNGYECSRTEYFRIIEAGESSIQSIETDNGSISIQLDAFGDYQYSLDGRNFYGSGVNHTFENIRGGIYTVYVRDRELCEEPMQANVSIISFPKFLTPNDDGFNDRWKIYGVSRQFYQSAETKIFDRYGKILYIMNLKENGIGWDGRFNGSLLSSNDYWFETKLVDIEGKTRIETGHFTLKN